MKIAVLITGEYRTFNFCRKTQLFLDQPDVDVYFCTWNKTNTLNPHRANSKGWEDYKPILREVTLDEIRTTLNRPAEILLQDVPQPPINPMIVGWCNGLDLVKKSGIEYDFILVMRPDLFFRPRAFIDPGYFYLYQDKVGFRPRPEKDLDSLDDTCFFSTYENIKKVITPELFDIPYLGHHQWFNHITRTAGLKITNLPILSENLIGRYPMDENTTWETVSFQWRRWFANGK